MALGSLQAGPATAGPAGAATDGAPAFRVQNAPAPPSGSPGTIQGPPTPFGFEQLRRAGGHLVDRDLLLQTGAIGAAAGLSALRDDDWTAWTVDHRPLGGDAYDIGYQIGHRRTQAGLVVALVAGGLLARQPDIRDTGLLLAQAHLVSSGVTQVLKSATDRRRPDGSNRSSFPSGHAVSAWTMAEVVQRRLGWWVGGPAYAAALYSGASRVQGNKHHPSDVIAGFALAHWIAAAVCRSVEPLTPDEPHVQWLPPAPAPAGTVALMRVRF